MMRPTPLLLVLDEPTASLDAPTEHALFERFAGAARAGAAQSAITVLVSHRFSTVRMADLILVVDGGRIAEAGDHAALMRAGGLYAELYQLQARGYR
jgi:ATP-binding cassette subfamily B protein